MRRGYSERFVVTIIRENVAESWLLQRVLVKDWVNLCIKIIAWVLMRRVEGRREDEREREREKGE